MDLAFLLGRRVPQPTNPTQDIAHDVGLGEELWGNC
jgi:hypothetical protein